ncbi:ion transporter [Planktothrix agardhii]|uniref:ion transporter n=1 Tax=Planktothrix agardhii TaxID=1160 RepID=UPI0028A95A08|nr:ion transporter [Planktothrix agardhii]
MILTELNTLSWHEWDNMVEKLKHRVFLLLETKEHPHPLGRFFKYFLIFLITLNTLVVCIESIDEMFKIYKTILNSFNQFSLGVFTLEYILRVWSCTILKKYSHPVWGRLKYMLTPLAIIDLIAFLPFYFYFDPGNFQEMKLLQLTRFLQILKLGRYSQVTQILNQVIYLRKKELVLTLNVVFFLLIFSGNLIYFAEHEAQPDKFPHIPASMWWAVITLTTVGYGDVYPITPLGRLLGGILALLGIGLIALPAGIIASGFTEVIARNKQANQTLYPKICPHCGKNIDQPLENSTDLDN